MPRLQKLVVAAGLAARRKCEELIRAGRVTVDGRAVLAPEQEVDPTRSRICVDGKPLPVAGADRPSRARTYLLLHKPAGVLSTCRDTHGRRTALDLVGKAGVRLYPVGRLDADTEGLLLLTDDGELTHRLTHPRYQVPKVYVAEVEGVVGEAALARLRRGVRLEDGLARADRVRLLGRKGERSRIELELHTGKKRQIRRMLAAVGLPVRTLTRTRLGPIALGRLSVGRWRKLTGSEVARLRRAGGLADSTRGT